jgi:spore coat protein U-like protein
MPSFTVALSAGNSNNFAQRQMGEVLGTENLNYNIYADAGFATIWGNGMAPSIIQSYNASAGLGTITYTAYGDLPANQYVGAGVYGDAITVTVTY